MSNQLPIDDERLSAFLDDELSREERAQIELLLEQREDYRNALEELRSVRSVLKSLPGPALSAEFADRVRTQVQAVDPTATSKEAGNETAKEITPARKGGFQSYIWPLAALAALVLAMLTLPSILSSNRNVATNIKSSAAAADSLELDRAEAQDGMEQQALASDEVSLDDFAPAEAMNEEFDSACLLYTSPSPRDKRQSRMPSSA